MSRFSKNKKSNKIVKYDKCPSLPLMSYGLAVSRSVYNVDNVKNVYIVDDNEGKMVYKDSILYLTTQFMLDSIQSYYEINLEVNEYGSISPKKFVYENKTYGDSKIETCNHDRRRGRDLHGRYSLPHMNIGLQALDILHYMKELGKTCIATNSDTFYTLVDRYTQGMQTFLEDRKIRMRVNTSHFISERFEFTRLKNEFLQLHSDSVEVCNDIRLAKGSLELFNKFDKKMVFKDEKDCKDVYATKTENLFYELGGQAHVSE